MTTTVAIQMFAQFSDDEDEIYDPNSAQKRGAGPKIQVKKNKW